MIWIRFVGGGTEITNVDENNAPLRRTAVAPSQPGSVVVRQSREVPQGSPELSNVGEHPRDLVGIRPTRGRGDHIHRSL